MTLQRLLGIELPIIQAPMAGVQGSALAVAVSDQRRAARISPGHRRYRPFARQSRKPGLR